MKDPEMERLLWVSQMGKQRDALEDAGSMSQGCWVPLNAGQSRETGLSLEPLEGGLTCWHLVSSPVKRTEGF